MWQLETQLFASFYIPGKLKHGDDVSQQKIKCRPIRAREIGGVSLSDVLYVNNQVKNNFQYKLLKVFIALTVGFYNSIKVYANLFINFFGCYCQLFVLCQLYSSLVIVFNP